MKPVDILIDIADAIRERGSLSAAAIPVRQFANRINAFVAGAANADARKFFHFIDFLTPAQEQEYGLWRCDGRPIYESVNPTMHALFKGKWQTGLIPVSPNRVFDTFRVVGNKLYVGSATASTTIFVINTTNGVITEITGLPSRPYTRFELIGTKIYCQHPVNSLPAANSIVCINTANDTFKLISVTNAAYNGFLLIDNRLFMGCRTQVTSLTYIDTTTETADTIPDITTAVRSQHLIRVGTKIYITSATGVAHTDFIVVVDTTRIGTVNNPVTGQITGLPSRYHDATYLAGRWLYIGSSSTTTYNTILRIDTQTDSYWGEIAVPQRKYSVTVAGASNSNTVAFPGKLIGSKLYVGADTSATTIVVVNNTTGAVAEITGLPSREWPLVDDDAASFTNWNTNWVFESSGSVWHKRTHLVGAKLYLSTPSGNYGTLVFLNTNAAWPPTDTVTEITGLASRAYNRFYANGTTLYCLTSTSANNIEMINTTTDARLTALAGLTSRAYGVPFVTGAGAAARLYLGSTLSATNIPIINLSNNTLVEDVTGLQSRIYAILMIYTGKIYVGTGGGGQAAMVILSDAVLPSHAKPVYIKPD